MRSFGREPDNRRKLYLQLIGTIESQLREAYAKRHEMDGLTQAEIARRLDINKSVVNRRLNGRTNLTVESLADMLWALKHCIHVDIYDPDDEDNVSNRPTIIPRYDDHAYNAAQPVTNSVIFSPSFLEADSADAKA